MGALAGPFAQQPERVFNSARQSEDVRLDPRLSRRHEPITRAETAAICRSTSNRSCRHDIPGAHQSGTGRCSIRGPDNLQQLCNERSSWWRPDTLVRRHQWTMTLIIRDDDIVPDHAVFCRTRAVPRTRTIGSSAAVGEGIAGIFTGQGPGHPQVQGSNDVHVPILPLAVCGKLHPAGSFSDLAGQREVSAESFLKVYGGYTPDHDAAQVSIKIKFSVRWWWPCCRRISPTNCMPSRRCSSLRWRRILPAARRSSL